MRRAIGASHGRVARQILTETVLLALLGAFVGTLLGTWALKVFLGMAPPGLPRRNEIAIDGTVVLATLAVAVVLGVSPDDVASHVKFKEKYGLPFTLLADEDHEVSKAYGTWVEKNMYGKRYMGVERSTFVIDADGTVSRVMRKVKPDTHAGDVLAALDA